MKKVSILLLLTVVLASFAFAIDGIGDFTAGVEFGLDNVGGGNEGALGVSIEPSIAFSRAFGAFGLAAKLGDVVYIPTDDTKQGDKIGDELYVGVTPSYTIAAGPGELGLSLGIQGRFWLADKAGFGQDGYTYTDDDGEIQTTFKLRIDPAVSYGLDAGFGALAFELGTDHLELGGNHGSDGKSFGLARLPIYFQAGLDLSFGLGFWLKPVFGLAIEDTDDDTALDSFNADIHYAITEQIAAGVEVNIPTYEDGIKADGVTITPRGEFSFGALGAYLKIELSKIAAENAAGDALDLQIKPIIGVSYSF
jgi:hypothetical protein